MAASTTKFTSLPSYPAVEQTALQYLFQQRLTFPAADPPQKAYPQPCLVLQQSPQLKSSPHSYRFQLANLLYNLNPRSEEHTSELQSRPHLVCRLLLEKKKKNK